MELDLTCSQTRTANFILAISASVGSTFVTTLALFQSITGGSSVWANQPPSIGFGNRIRCSGARRSFGESMVRILRFFFAMAISFAPSL